MRALNGDPTLLASLRVPGPFPEDIPIFKAKHFPHETTRLFSWQTLGFHKRLLLKLHSPDTSGKASFLGHLRCLRHPTAASPDSRVSTTGQDYSIELGMRLPLCLKKRGVFVDVRGIAARIFCHQVETRKIFAIRLPLSREERRDSRVQKKIARLDLFVAAFRLYGRNGSHEQGLWKVGLYRVSPVVFCRNKKQFQAKERHEVVHRS
ncbi:hypothetical protein VTL71DRAFT_6356 [Oculimacula yallundae]|uniref:Uncharacterized protein n=1 Tax=Oculimacula yallundae TaxID=86028 RepID=A0ABR4BWR2_9HELO